MFSNSTICSCKIITRAYSSELYNIQFYISNFRLTAISYLKKNICSYSSLAYILVVFTVAVSMTFLVISENVWHIVLHLCICRSSLHSYWRGWNYRRSYRSSGCFIRPLFCNINSVILNTVLWIIKCYLSLNTVYWLYLTLPTGVNLLLPNTWVSNGLTMHTHWILTMTLHKLNIHFNTAIFKNFSLKFKYLHR